MSIFNTYLQAPRIKLSIQWTLKSIFTNYQYTLLTASCYLLYTDRKESVLSLTFPDMYTVTSNLLHPIHTHTHKAGSLGFFLLGCLMSLVPSCPSCINTWVTKVGPTLQQFCSIITLRLEKSLSWPFRWPQSTWNVTSVTEHFLSFDWRSMWLMEYYIGQHRTLLSDSKLPEVNTNDRE